MSWSKDEISPGDLDFHVRPFIEPDFLGDGFRDPNTQAVSPFCNPSAQSPPLFLVLKIHNGYTPKLARFATRFQVPRVERLVDARLVDALKLSQTSGIPIEKLRNFQ